MKKLCLFATFLAFILSFCSCASEQEAYFAEYDPMATEKMELSEAGMEGVSREALATTLSESHGEETTDGLLTEQSFLESAVTAILTEPLKSEETETSESISETKNTAAETTVTSAITEKATAATKEETITIPDTIKITEEDHTSYIVYITKTGKKYHNAGCRYLSKSCIPIDLKDAIGRGYTKCSRC